MDGTVPRARWGVYVGLLLITLATLTYQMLLTRIFSVTMWYHFSFLAISVTMFGMTVGAILVYLRPAWFEAAAADQRMGLAALVFSVLIVVSFLTHLSIPFIVRPSLVHIWAVAVQYVVLSLPFVASGVAVTVALTRFPGQIGRLYAVDLIGAGLGCLVVAVALSWIDAPTLVIDVSALASAGAVFALVGTPARGLRRLSLAATLVLVALSVASNVMAIRQTPLIRPVWVKGHLQPTPLYEKWNAFSHVGVWDYTKEPFGWGLSARCPAEEEAEQKILRIDSSAATVMTRLEGDPAELNYLRYDVTNLAHFVRPRGRVLIVGAGGGRDLLSALHFDQREIVGVEINGAILDTVNRRFGDFTGHLNRFPNVRLVHDEARSYIARTKEEFDIIQVSLIDTWAATAAGAFVLTENSLYTVEAWKRMLGRLSDRGLITFSRWHSEAAPGELYRLAALAAESLKRTGVKQPEKHLVVVHRSRDETETAAGVATLLASRNPLSEADVKAVRKVCQEMDFHLLLAPGFVSDPLLKRLCSAEDTYQVARSYPIDISPPSDDNPFFFNMLRLRDMFDLKLLDTAGVRANMMAVSVLGVLLITVTALTGLCIVVPLWLTTKREWLAGSLPYFVYFAGIGLGFMLVEITLMQRLNVFLGHPIYGMTVVLFCLLVSCGCGSWLSGILVSDVRRGFSALACLALLLAAVLTAGFAGMPLLSSLDWLPTPGRIAVACAILLPLGLTMGMGFPLGMRAAGLGAANLGAWLFGINGAMSICGSVLAIVLSLSFGIRAAFFLGAGCYVAAWFAFLWVQSTLRGREDSSPAATPRPKLSVLKKAA